MKKLILPLMLLLLVACQTKQEVKPIEDAAAYVDPFIVTGGTPS